MSHVLAAGVPSATGGENSHCCAAFRARPAKYLLGPGCVSFADVTFPDESTSTWTLTLIVPEMVLRALGGTSGRTWWRTSPRVGADFLGAAIGSWSGGLDAGAVAASGGACGAGCSLGAVAGAAAFFPWEWKRTNPTSTAMTSAIAKMSLRLTGRGTGGAASGSAGTERPSG